MKVNAFTRTALGAGAAALAVGALVAPAAQADPAAGTYGTLVGVGSDTTQDVMNAIATAVGGGTIASYDATGAGTFSARATGGLLPRPNGSGSGRDVLRVAIGQTPQATITIPNGTGLPVLTQDVHGLVDFARSSSGPAASDTRPDGVLAYIPFATDALTYAVAPGSAIPSDLTTDQITAIYKGSYDRAEVNGAGDKKLLLKGAPVDAGYTAYQITTFIPQAGSGTRSYWLGKVGVTETDISNNTYPNITNLDFKGASVQEHHGQALTSGTDAQNKGAIAPFSAGQWIAQGNGLVADNRAGVVLGSVGGVNPIAGAAAPFSLNPTYNGYTRLVYNIVPSRLADDPSSLIAKTFVGPDSDVCKQTSTIVQYGFAALTGSLTCGDTTTRAYQAAASSTTVTLTKPAAATVGKAATVSASVKGSSVGGGTVFFATQAGGKTIVVGSKAVAAGNVTATLSYTPKAAGSTAFVAYYIPSLLGVDASPVSAAQTLTASTATVSSSTKVAASAKPVVGGTVTLTATVTATKYASGSVAFYDGTKKLGSATFSTSTHKATFKLKATKTSYAIKAVYTPSSTTVVKGSTSSVVSVKPAKAKAKITVAKIASVAHTKHATAKITVTASGVTPTGSVVVKDGTKTLVTKSLSGGKVTISLPTLKKGTHSITVQYKGSTTVGSVTSAKQSLKIS